MTAFRRGDRARVIDVTDPKTGRPLVLASGKACPFALNDEIEIAHVSDCGDFLVTHKHPGFFRAARFEKL